ncbi:MAG: beta-N-acetylhexosaminidase [Bdellovibrionales bacterium]|nr:beta-N-acetylhexosaminidase [Bdellovibrionales bacterium]
MKNDIFPLFISIKGKDLLKEEENFIKKERPAGLILFKKNIESQNQIIDLNKKIKNLISPTPLISVDCEGGEVNRLSHLGEQTLWPSPEELSYFSPEKIFSISKQMGTYLKNLGFDINFAPVIDLPIVSSNLLKTRVFSSSPLVVIEKASVFMKALLEAGIVPCLKHFPGHGGVEQDSHKVLPKDFRTLKELSIQLDLFEKLFKKHLCAVMTAHIEFPHIEKTPASFSKKILTQILKTKQKFKGLVFSDDIDMKALEAFSPGEAFFLAIRAGCDIVLTCQKEQSPYEIIEYLKKHPKKRKLLENKFKITEEKVLNLRKKQNLPL